MNYDQLQRAFDNMNRCDAAVYKWKQTKLEDGYVIQLKCFNKEEAEECARYMDYKYPQVPYFKTWVDFSHLES